MTHSEDTEGSSRYSVTYNHPGSSTQHTDPTSEIIFKETSLWKLNNKGSYRMYHRK